MSYDSNEGKWVLTDGDLAYWIDDQGHPVRVKIELVTRDRVYLRATAQDYGVPAGKRWYEARYSKRVAPREATYVHRDRAHVNWQNVLIKNAA